MISGGTGSGRYIICRQILLLRSVPLPDGVVRPLFFCLACLRQIPSAPWPHISVFSPSSDSLSCSSLPYLSSISKSMPIFLLHSLADLVLPPANASLFPLSAPRPCHARSGALNMFDGLPRRLTAPPPPWLCGAARGDKDRARDTMTASGRCSNRIPRWRAELN